MEIEQFTWGRIFGSATGAALAGPVGQLVGFLAGGLLQSLLPGGHLATTTFASMLGTFAGRTVEGSSTRLIGERADAEAIEINHDLQSAFRASAEAAFKDIGGRHCFAEEWARGRDVPEAAVFPIERLRRVQPELADQLYRCFHALVEAIEAGRLVPLEPPAGQMAAQATLYLDADSPAALAGTFYEEVLAPFLRQEHYDGLVAELRLLGHPLDDHLRRHWLDRTLVHLGELLKQRPLAWRAFNRRLLESVRSEVRSLREEQAELPAVEQLAAFEAQLTAAIEALVGVAGMADGLAELVAATGRAHKAADEHFDTLFTRLEEEWRQVGDQFALLQTSSGRVEAKLDRVLFLIENLRWEVAGTPAIPVDPPPEAGDPPLPGLQLCGEADAGQLFGRELLTARLVERLHRQRFLAIVGAAGSGKSSLVRAGVVPALRRGEPLANGQRPPPGCQTWPIYMLTPTANPLEALAASLTRQASSPAETAALMADLAHDPRSLKLYTCKLLSRSPAGSQHHPPGDRRIVLVIDQFEEIFTFCRDDGERQAFVANLVAAVDAGFGNTADGPVTIILALRADFYAHCAHFAGLPALLASHQEFIERITADELRRATRCYYQQ